MITKMKPADAVGFAGVALLLMAFGLNLYGALPSHSPVYIGMNAVGAGVAGYASYMIRYWPFVILEATWCLTSLIRFIADMPGGG
jgi:hypothetical protein